MCRLWAQITAEQILREAKDLQEQDFKPPKQKITDQAELDTYRLRKRKEFEDLVRRVRWNQSVWIKVLVFVFSLCVAWCCCYFESSAALPSFCTDAPCTALQAGQLIFC